jgi:hypothetical protein
MTDAAIERLCERLEPISPEAAALIRSQAERVKALESALELWVSGRRRRDLMPDGHPCIMDYPEDPNAEIRDSETGEVIFPARKAPFRVIDGVCVCVARGDGPEGCGICNETGEP